MGYADPACYGGTLLQTPHIDKLAREGVRFTDGYATAAVCGPSRSGIITGTYQQRFGMQANPDGNRYTVPAMHKVMPEALSAAGYKTGMFGKWNMPQGKGAEELFTEANGVMDWVGDFWPNADGRFNGVDDGPSATHMDWLPHWGPERPGDEYLTDKLTRHTVDFIEKYKDVPFFIYLAYNAPHNPWQAKLSDRNETIAQLWNEPKAIYAAMVKAVDDGVGRVLDRLYKDRIDSRTLVAFVSDNGPDSGHRPQPGWKAEWPNPVVMGDEGALSGGKNQLAEGGIRVPFIMRWPGTIPRGEVYTEPVMSFDFYTTFLAAAGADIPSGTDLSGANLLPFVRGEATSRRPHDLLFWKSKGHFAVRWGDWKLSTVYARGSEGGVALYNLRDDIGETHDQSTIRPDIKRNLLDEYRMWCARMPVSASGIKNC